MSIFIASDHAGFDLKEYLRKQFKLSDVETYDNSSCDYPIFAKKLVRQMRGEDKGILICGTGIGMSIVANRHKNVRAALCLNKETAILSRQYNNTNILVLGARIISTEVARRCIENSCQSISKAVDINACSI